MSLPARGSNSLPLSSRLVELLAGRFSLFSPIKSSKLKVEASKARAAEGAKGPSRKVERKEATPKAGSLLAER